MGTVSTIAGPGPSPRPVPWLFERPSISNIGPRARAGCTHHPEKGRSPPNAGEQARTQSPCAMAWIGYRLRTKARPVRHRRSTSRVADASTPRLRRSAWIFGVGSFICAGPCAGMRSRRPFASFARCAQQRSRRCGGNSGNGGRPHGAPLPGRPLNAPQTDRGRSGNTTPSVKPLPHRR